jgi:hypothetical protein
VSTVVRFDGTALTNKIEDPAGSEAPFTPNVQEVSPRAVERRDAPVWLATQLRQPPPRAPTPLGGVGARTAAAGTGSACSSAIFAVYFFALPAAPAPLAGPQGWRRGPAPATTGTGGWGTDGSAPTLGQDLGLRQVRRPSRSEPTVVAADSVVDVDNSVEQELLARRGVGQRERPERKSGR